MSPKFSLFLLLGALTTQLVNSFIRKRDRHAHNLLDSAFLILASARKLLEQFTFDCTPIADRRNYSLSISLFNGSFRIKGTTRAQGFLCIYIFFFWRSVSLFVNIYLLTE